jgi:hypothetical protein
MAPTQTLANQVADAVLALCQAIDSAAAPNTFYSKPRTVERLLQPSALSTDARPVIGVQVMRFQDRLVMGNRHETEVQIGVHLVAEDAVNAELVLSNLARDVIYQLRANEQLGGLLKVPIGDVEYTPDVELMLSHQVAYAVVSFTALALRDHTAP